MDTTLTSADLVIDAMISAERSKKWTADKAGIPISTFARKLAGHTDFTVGELARVAAALNVRPSTLLPDTFRDVA